MMKAKRPPRLGVSSTLSALAVAFGLGGSDASAAIFQEQSASSSVVVFAEPTLLPGNQLLVSLALKTGGVADVTGGVISFSFDNPDFGGIVLDVPPQYAASVEPLPGNPKLLTLTFPEEVPPDLPAGTLVSWRFTTLPASPTWSVVFTANGSLSRFDPNTFEDLPDAPIQAMATYSMPVPEPGSLALLLCGLVALAGARLNRAVA